MAMPDIARLIRYFVIRDSRCDFPRGSNSYHLYRMEKVALNTEGNGWQQDLVQLAGTFVHIHGQETAQTWRICKSSEGIPHPKWLLFTTR